MKQEYFAGMESMGEHMTVARSRQLARRLEHNRLKLVNDALYHLGLTYHEFVPLDVINALLTNNRYQAIDFIFVCGRDGRMHEFVGDDRWLSLTWHKMQSGRYEVIAYVS